MRAPARRRRGRCDQVPAHRAVRLEEPAGAQVRATVVMTSTKKVSTDENYSYSSLQRHLYQGGFKFCWNIASGQYYVLDSEPLSEIFQEPRGKKSYFYSPQLSKKFLRLVSTLTL